MKKLFAIAMMTALVGFAFTGCKSTQKAKDSHLAETTRWDLRWDLMSYTDTDQELLNRITYAQILNGEGFIEDTLRFWLMERPSRLTFKPVN